MSVCLNTTMSQTFASNHPHLKRIMLTNKCVKLWDILDVKLTSSSLLVVDMLNAEMDRGKDLSDSDNGWIIMVKQLGQSISETAMWSSWSAMADSCWEREKPQIAVKVLGDQDLSM